MKAHQARFGCIAQMPCPPWPFDQQSIPLLPLQRVAPASPAGYEETHPSILARKHAFAAQWSSPPIGATTSVEATATTVPSSDGDEQPIVQSIASTWAGVVGPEHANIQVHTRRERSPSFAEYAPQDSPIIGGSGSKIIDRTGLSRTEEYEGIVGPPFDIPSSPTDSIYECLISTPAKVRDRLIQIHQGHPCASTDEMSDQASPSYVEKQDTEATDGIQTSEGSVSPAAEIVVPPSQSPRR
ncbi:hypothetical protein EYR38_009126 [Pleurotus pulmonarius]|nr:hypothetical protein EYR38_009126 [Pleurotus pulmonarius]